MGTGLADTEAKFQECTESVFRNDYSHDVAFRILQAVMVLKLLANRYHLYVSLACPWRTRVIMRHLKATGIISVSAVNAHMNDEVD